MNSVTSSTNWRHLSLETVSSSKMWPRRSRRIIQNSSSYSVVLFTTTICFGSIRNGKQVTIKYTHSNKVLYNLHFKSLFSDKMQQQSQTSAPQPSMYNQPPPPMSDAAATTALPTTEITSIAQLAIVQTHINTAKEQIAQSEVSLSLFSI